MNTVLFDLDGTLLPMDQELFIKSYFKSLDDTFSGMFNEPSAFRTAMWLAINNVLKNDGSMSNKDRFNISFTGFSGVDPSELENEFNYYYDNNFKNLDGIKAPDPLAAECVRTLRAKGYSIVLATNPVFPRVATLKRIGWAGLCEEHFDHITTYENSSYCKPDLKYYTEILSSIGREASQCLMVGNDVREDMCAAKLGIDTFLLNSYVINPDGEDMTQFRTGGLNQLLSYIKGLPHARTLE